MSNDFLSYLLQMNGTGRRQPSGPATRLYEGGGPSLPGWQGWPWEQPQRPPMDDIYKPLPWEQVIEPTPGPNGPPGPDGWYGPIPNYNPQPDSANSNFSGDSSNYAGEDQGYTDQGEPVLVPRPSPYPSAPKEYPIPTSPHGQAPIAPGFEPDWQNLPPGTQYRYRTGAGTQPGQQRRDPLLDLIRMMVGR